MSGERAVAAALLLPLALAGCTTIAGRMHVLECRTSVERPGNYLGLPLRSGQVLLSEAPGAHSLLFSLSTATYADFTHAALLVMEDGLPFVYEMSGEYDACFVDRPTDGIVGSVKRVDLEAYVRSYLYVEILDPPPEVDVERTVAWVHRKYDEQVPFDAYFDYGEHERLYCTEFVQLALEAGGGAPARLQPVRQHASLQRLLEWFGVDRVSCLPAACFHDPERRVAALGQLPSLTAAACYFAAKRELHARFSDDQQLGNLFVIDSFADIRLRDEIVYFQRRAVRLFDGAAQPSPAQVAAAVSELAAAVFGTADAAADPDAPGGTP